MKFLVFNEPQIIMVNYWNRWENSLNNRIVTTSLWICFTLNHNHLTLFVGFHRAFGSMESVIFRRCRKVLHGYVIKFTLFYCLSFIALTKCSSKIYFQFSIQPLWLSSLIWRYLSMVYCSQLHHQSAKYCSSILC